MQIADIKGKISFFQSLNVIFIALSVSLIVISDYIFSDGFWTPLRGIHFLLDTGNYNNLFFKNLVENSIHNDSIKLFPTLIEFLPSAIIGYWSPRISLLIGILSWLICYLVFRDLINKIFEIKDEKKNYLSLFLSICFFSSPFFFTRFTQVFAVHKTIPLICSVGIFSIIFQKSRNYILQNKDLLKITLLSLLAQFSFASGVFLLPITALAILWKSFLMPKGKIRKFFYYYLFIAVLFLIIYFGFFNYDHIIERTIKTYEDKNLISNYSIALFTSYIFTYCSSFFNGFNYYGSKYFVALSYLQFAFYGFCLLLFSRNYKVIFSKGNIFKVSPLIFIIFFNLFGLFAILISSGPSSMVFSGRYFCESIVLSLSLLAIFIFYTIQINKNFLNHKILYIWLLLLCLTNLISYGPYVVAIKNKFLGSQNNENFGQVLLIRCIKNNKSPSYESLKNECNLDKYFWYFKDENLLEHSSIRIYDVDDYSKKVFKVFGNKNQYKILK